LIRDAKFADIPRLVSLLQGAYERSHYAKEGLGAIDIGEAKRLLTAAMQRHGGKNGGATWVQVAETDGFIEGMILGTLQRVYAIGDKLMCSDIFWVCTDKVAPLDPFKLMKGMIEWGRSCPSVVEFKCGTTAALQDPEAAGVIMKRLGFAQYGIIWRLT
jgi:hypothetical protein